MKTAINPILRGFNPDPSIIRVEGDYYIATSTFEWFPGVQIHHSRDLINWDLVTHPLNRPSQLDMIGVADSCGVWAPCLSYDQGTFYLVYSNVRNFDGPWKDMPSYLVTTTDILGDWSEPVFLHSKGFDLSLFHDRDGRKWLATALVDHRNNKLFGGILLQEYDPASHTLTGPEYAIFDGTELGCTEAPHIYQLNGYYYLITAEGGTEYGHAVTLARSRSLTGPYEVHPQNPVISSRNNPLAPLQKAGHADLVQTQNGDWYAVFLVGRPLTPLGRCTLGRETAIEALEWREDGWLYLKHGRKEPGLEVPVPDLASHTFEAQPDKDDFSQEPLGIHFQSLRIPVSEDWASLRIRPGYLRLFGKESLSSLHHQSLIARRVQHFHIEASTCLEFAPRSFQQMAGLVCYYNTYHWHYLHVSASEDVAKRLLHIISCDKHITAEPLQQAIQLPVNVPIYLKVVFNREKLQFYYASQPNEWKEVGPVLNGSLLSDDYVRDESNRYRPAFTGAFVGICCQDLTGQRLHADFDWFEYKEMN